LHVSRSDNQFIAVAFEAQVALQVLAVIHLPPQLRYPMRFIPGERTPIGYHRRLTCTVTFASSTGSELALERSEWGNGAFTKAIIEGLFEGRADLLPKSTITLSQLDAYVADRVKTLTGGVQHPIMIRPPTVPDFPIALATK
jgi:hypothetical protein